MIFIFSVVTQLNPSKWQSFRGISLVPLVFNQFQNGLNQNNLEVSYYSVGYHLEWFLPTLYGFNNFLFLFPKFGILGPLWNHGRFFHLKLFNRLSINSVTIYRPNESKIYFFNGNGNKSILAKGGLPYSRTGGAICSLLYTFCNCSLV